MIHGENLHFEEGARFKCYLEGIKPNVTRLSLVLPLIFKPFFIRFSSKGSKFTLNPNLSLNL